MPMTNEDLIAMLANLQKQLAIMIMMVSPPTNGPTLPAQPLQPPTPIRPPAPLAPVLPTLPTPPPPPPNPLYEQDINHMLVHVRAYGNNRVDPLVGPDCPFTVTLPKTGHTLSEPQIGLGEMFMGYCMRVADQATGGDGDKYLPGIGSLFLGTGHLFAKTPQGVFNPDGSNWPMAADCYYNMRAYMTPEEKVQDAASQAGWAKWDEEVKARVEKEKNPTPAPAPVGGDLPPGETPL